ncbi:glutamate--cysteine ligase [Leifsonia sp. SIMBA_070]|uniref:carboxylate-amine ligase n=1 Tax=Leifsonia sp. SIMBA_070 TaxID=3085810 RepID=UPI00397CD270
MRTFGVEEELLLVDDDGRTAPVAESVLGGAEQRDAGGPQLAREIQQEMIEVISRPHETSARLLEEVFAGRARAEAEAARFGAHAVALAASPLPSRPHPSETARYLGFMERYGRTARTSLTCGLHVHVSVDSPEEGVGVLDRIRTWLPLLVALSANSAVVDGEDTGYESFRFEAWNRWPGSGPTEVFGSVDAYREFEEGLLSTGVIVDQGMLYLDARLSRTHPTVEVRVADVCQDPGDAVTIAAVVRALVETAAREWQAGLKPCDVPATLIRLASWKAALCGVGAELLHPVRMRPVPAREAVRELFLHIADSADDAGDGEVVRSGLSTILARRTGSTMQRRAFARSGDPGDVVREALRVHQRSSGSVAALADAALADAAVLADRQRTGEEVAGRGSARDQGLQLSRR